MSAGRLFIEQALSPERALQRGAALPQLVSPEQPIALYGAPLEGDAFVLGRHQLESQVFARANSESVSVSPLRRSSGGATVHGGAGVVYAALALHDRNSLMACPPGRLLNRNVRGALQGLRLAGVPANYFGRDFVSFAARPAVYVAWDATDDGRVLLEFFISAERSCFVADSALRYPPRNEPSLRGQSPTSLAESDIELPAETLIEKLAEGHTKSFGVVWERAQAELLTPLESPPLPAADSALERSLTWSMPREEAIGFVSAGVGLDRAGKFAAVRVAGDFFAHRACATTLERVLLGVTPAPDLVARAVDAAFAHTGHDVEGIRQLRTFQDAIIDAANSAVSDLRERGTP
jgi:hypothetical protein